MHQARPSWRRWPDWVAYATAAWSLGYSALGIWWARGGAGFPFGLANDSGATLSWFTGATARKGGPVIAAAGAIATLVALYMARQGHTERVGSNTTVATVVKAFGWTVAVILCLGVPDFRVLVVVAYAPIILLGAPFDWPQPVRLVDVIPWPVLNQAVCIVGGVAWAATTLAFQRRVGDACAYCGRRSPRVEWQQPDAARRWGGWAVAVAVAIPLLYAATRFAWALGIPLGLTEAFYREGERTGLWWRGAALATLAVVGAALTVGLAKPWGEVFPRWVPRLAGRRVPPALAIVPATFVSLIVSSAGLMFVRMAIRGTFMLGTHRVTFTENWGGLWPELVWPIWGVALGAATLAYQYRTRQRCRYCGRD